MRARQVAAAGWAFDSAGNPIGLMRPDGKVNVVAISVIDFMSSAQRADVLAGTMAVEVTDALQAAIDFAEAIAFPVTEKGRIAIRLPAGGYYSDGVTADKKITLLGDGKECVFWKLKTGSTASLITLNAEDIAGTSLDDTDHSVVQGMTLIGNRVDSTTTGTSRAIHCPATAWAQATQYSTAFIGRDLEIHGFTGDGIHTGTNRNWALLSNVIVRYCNDNGFATYGYDHRLVNCDFGVNKNFGVRGYAGGAHVFTGCNLYFNLKNVVLNASVDAPFVFIGGSNDGAQQEGFFANGTAGVDHHALVGVRFTNNSTSGANTYSDINAAGPEFVQVVACQFVYANQKTKYLVETSGGSTVMWLGNSYDGTGGASTPYQTALTNDFTKLIWGGDANAYFGPTAANAAGVWVGGSNVAKWDATQSYQFIPDRMQSTVPKHWEDESDQAADNRIWMRQINGGILQWFVANDAEAVFTPWLKVTRSGTSVSRVEFPSSPVGFTSYAKAALPAATTAGMMIYVTDDVGGAVPAFSDGTDWRRVTDRAVIA